MADNEPRLLSLSTEPADERRPGVTALPMTCKSGGTVDLYVEPVLPSPRVVVFGSTPTARTLVRIAHAMGYRAEVVDPDAVSADFPEATQVTRAISPDVAVHGAYVLVATMDERDAAVRLAPAYLGVIASRKRFAQLVDALGERGISRGVLDGIVAPAGLDIGARTPEEIALSVMAQIVERRRKAAAAPAPEKAAAPAPEPTEAIDPVCGMTVAIAGARHTAEVSGRRYYFCCAGCRAKFVADPSRYPWPRERAHT